MPKGTSPATVDDSKDPEPEADRLELQAILGQVHGLYAYVIDHPIEFLPAEPPDLGPSIQAGYPEVSVAFGGVQSELNSGDHDQNLVKLGLARELGNPKMRGFRHNLHRFVDSLRKPPTDATPAARFLIRALKWSNIIVGSLSKELDKVKGIEVIKEFGEVLVTGIEQALELKAERRQGG